MQNLFIQNLFEPDGRFYFFAVVLTVIVSIVLHELAHGAAALRLGDQTPRLQGRMTGNPLVHMGPFSLVALALIGIAWGSMPIDPSRMKGKFAEAKVAFAGPATNLTLSLLALTALGLWERFYPVYQIEVDSIAYNGMQLLNIVGIYNLLLFVFNLLPVPPLDGSHILANFSDGYARAVSDPSKQGIFLFAFFFAFMTAQVILAPLVQLAFWYVNLVSGTPY